MSTSKFYFYRYLLITLVIKSHEASSWASRVPQFRAWGLHGFLCGDPTVGGLGFNGLGFRGLGFSGLGFRRSGFRVCFGPHVSISGGLGRWGS